MKMIQKWEARIENRLRRGVCSLDMGSDAPPPPAPDPMIGQAASFSAETGRMLAEEGKKQLEFERARAAEFDPILREQLQQQIRIARENEARAADQWRDYTTTYRPIEQQVAREAMEWDTDAAIEREAQKAGALAARAYAATRDAAMRNLQAMGVNPASGRYVSAATDLGLAAAAARANAENAAAEARRAQGLQLRGGVAQFGRGLPSTGIAAGTLGLNASNVASDSALQTMLAPGRAAAQALPWMSSGVQAGLGAGQLALGGYNAQLGAWNTQQQIEGQNMAGLGSMLGNLAGIGLSTWLKGSSKDIKEDKEPIDGVLVLERLESLPVERWRYKAGEGDGGAHIGPYAEDVQAQFGNAAAPGGEMIDLMTMQGIALAGIKELAKRVKRMEQIGLDAAPPRMKPRDTEPRRVS